MTAITIPEVRHLGDTFILSWDDSNIEMKISHITEKESGFHGELLVSQEGGHLYQAKANLLSPGAKKTLAKELNTRINTVEWAALLEQAFTKVVMLYREGDPAVEFWTDEEGIDPPRFLLEPLIYEGLPSIIFGEKAVCKSTLALVIYACLILPWADNPLGWTTPTKSVRALLLDYEVDRRIVQHNASLLQKGMGLPAFPILYRKGFRPVSDDIDQIQKFMLEHNANVLIIDSMAPAVGGDLKDAAQALKLTSALRQLDCASLLIGQTSKDRESKHKSVYGSTFFEYYARNIFELRKAQEEGSDEMDIALYQTYCNLSKRIAPMGFHISYKDNIKIESQAITMPALIERMSTASRMIDLLKSGRLPTNEIKETLGITRNTADQTLKRLKGKGIVAKFDNEWGLIHR